MKIKWGALVTAGSGKIGGHVAARNSSGSYLRTKVTPNNPQTPDQVAARARLGANAKGWTELTQPQRNAWNASSSDYSAKNVFGDAIKLSGINVFSRLNNNLNLIDKPSLVNPPQAESFAGPTAIIVVSAVTGSVLTISSDVEIPVGGIGVVRFTAPQSAGKNFVKSEYRIIGTLPAGPIVAEDVSTEYVNKFGALPLAGEKVFCELFFVSENSGIASQRVSNSIITAV